MHLHIKTVKLFATSPIDYSRISEKKDKYNARIHSDYFRCTTRYRYSGTCYFKTWRYCICRKSNLSRSDSGFSFLWGEIIDIKLTKEGIDLVDLENKLRKFRPKLIYVMPNIQNPTGISYTKANCRRLMGLARFYNAYILEDDYISGLCYQEKSPIPLKAYDTDDRVIYIRSLSKIFMPGLRLAYLIMPQVLAQTLLNVKHISDIATSGLTQRVFDYYLREGLWQEHLNSIRSVYKTQFEFALRMAKKYLPKDIDYLKPQGGLSLWLNLPDRLSASEIIEKARNEGVIICDGAPFFVRNAPNKQIRLSFATLSLAEINTGIKIIQNITKY